MKGLTNGKFLNSKRLSALLCIAVAVTMLLSINALTPAKTQAASKKTVYVITKETDSTSTTYYSYNKRGFIKKAVLYYNGERWNSSIYSYGKKKKGKLACIAQQDRGGRITSFYYKKNGLLKKYGDGDGYHNVVKRKNCLATVIKCNTSHETNYISYNKKKQIVKEVSKSPYGTFTTTYSYDSKGNISKSDSIRYKNIYKNGRLIQNQIRQKDGSYKVYKKYTYKKITVPAKYVKRVKKQQWGVRNPVGPVYGFSMIQ